MSVDRVATNSQTSYMLSQIAKANAKLQQSSEQTASGKISSDYAGIGDKTAALEGARAAADRASGYATNTQLAVTQTDLQDTQLSTLSGLAQQLQKAITSAAGNSDGTSLMTTAQSVFEQASSILNSTDSNGNYLYAGEKTDTKPFTATAAVRRAWVRFARALGCSAEAVFFDTPTKTCKARNQARARVVPDDVMLRFAGRLTPPTLKEGFTQVTVIKP